MSTFIRVIPAVRTPMGVEHFDYRLPPSCQEVKPGDLVIVPFRRKKTVALVAEIMSESAFANRIADVMSRYADIRLPITMVKLLRWTAERTFSSQPTVLNSWLRHLPARPKTITANAIKKREGAGGMEAHWTIDAREALLSQARKWGQDGSRLLILTPWKTRVSAFLSALPQAAALHGDQADGEAFRTWQAFAAGHIPILITTRLGAWLAPLADHVLIDEPENDDHKQDELAPRYDARLVAAWAATHAHTHVESFGLTPPLHVTAEAPDIPVELVLHPHQRNGRSSIPLIQADTLLRLESHEGPRIIFHPIKGVRARLACRDCGWRARCGRCGAEPSAEMEQAVCRVCGATSPLPLTCPTCGGTDLGKSLPGIELLKRAWQKDPSLPPVEWRDTSNEDVDASLPAQALVVVTLPSLLGGGGEDIRREEHRLIAFRRLADRVHAAQGTFLLQTEGTSSTPEDDAEDQPAWNSWLKTEGIKKYKEREYNARRLFDYPPAVRLAKALIDGDATTAKTWMEEAQTILKGTATVRGPFPVPFRSQARTPRSVCHLLFPPGTTERSLITLLSPLSKRAMIDLDPIAFFR
jgi:primosomal protein N'